MKPHKKNLRLAIARDIKAGSTYEEVLQKYAVSRGLIRKLSEELARDKLITEKEFDRFRNTEKAGGNKSIMVKTLGDTRIPQPREGGAAIGVVNMHVEPSYETYGNGTHVGHASQAPSQERDYWYTWIDGFLMGPMSEQGLCDIVRKEADDAEDLRAIGPFSEEELRDMGVPESSLEKPILSWRPTPPEGGLSDIAGQGEIRGGGLQKRNPKVWKHARDIPFLSELIP